MDSTLSPELRALQESTRKLVDKELLPLEKELNETGCIPKRVPALLKELGYYGITIPEQWGGMGMGLFETAVVFEQLFRVPKPFVTPVLIANSLATWGIINAGTDQQKDHYVPLLASGQIEGALALTEPNAGSDVAAITTTARREGNSYVINGTKHFITQGASAEIVMVVAYTDKTKGTKGGISLFIVPRGTPGMNVGRMQSTMGGPPDVHAELFFEECRVPVENIVGPEGTGFLSAMKTLNKGRIFVSCLALGEASRALDLATDYAKERIAFGQPIAQFQAIQHMLADSATDLYAAQSTLYRTAQQADEGGSIAKEVAMCKLFVTEAAWRVADRAMQIFGGMGYMQGMPVERLFREIRHHRIVDGTSEIQKRIIGGYLVR